MRILNKAEFLKCPDGTLFFDLHEGSAIIENLSIKNESLGDDFVRTDIGSLCNLGNGERSARGSEEAMEFFYRADAGETVSYHFDTGARDASYSSQRFAVLDRDDVRRLILALDAAYGVVVDVR